MATIILARIYPLRPAAQLARFGCSGFLVSKQIPEAELTRDLYQRKSFRELYNGIDPRESHNIGRVSEKFPRKPCFLALLG